MSASGETSGALISAEPPLMDIMVELAFFFLSAVDEADAGAEVRAAGVQFNGIPAKKVITYDARKSESN